ncbi:hypothetical protein TNCV_2304651 [Trichonephila clavipes]|nr:hypothetical protein TNCV_2304651 [Trichonephila clavipes]
MCENLQRGLEESIPTVSETLSPDEEEEIIACFHLGCMVLCMKPIKLGAECSVLYSSLSGCIGILTPLSVLEKYLVKETKELSKSRSETNDNQHNSCTFRKHKSTTDNGETVREFDSSISMNFVDQDTSIKYVDQNTLMGSVDQVTTSECTSRFFDVDESVIGFVDHAASTDCSIHQATVVNSIDQMDSTRFLDLEAFEISLNHTRAQSASSTDQVAFASSTDQETSANFINESVTEPCMLSTANTAQQMKFKNSAEHALSEFFNHKKKVPNKSSNNQAASESFIDQAKPVDQSESIMSLNDLIGSMSLIQDATSKNSVDQEESRNLIDQAVIDILSDQSESTSLNTNLAIQFPSFIDYALSTSFGDLSISTTLINQASSTDLVRPGHIYGFGRPGHIYGFGRPDHIYGFGRPGHIYGFGRPGHIYRFGRPGHIYGFGRPGRIGRPDHIYGFGRPGHIYGFGRPGHIYGFGRPGRIGRQGSICEFRGYIYECSRPSDSWDLAASTGRRQDPCTSGIGKTAASTNFIDQAMSMSGIDTSSSINLIDLNLKGNTLPIMDSLYQAAFKSAFDQDSLPLTNLFDRSVATNTSTGEMDQAAPTRELGLASSESFDDHVMPEISTGQVGSTNLDPQTTNSKLIFPTFHDIFQSNRGASIYIPPIFPNLKHQATSTNLIYQSTSTRGFLKVKSTNVKNHAASTSGMDNAASTSEPFHDGVNKDSTDDVIGVQVSHESSSNKSHLDNGNSNPNLIDFVLLTQWAIWTVKIPIRDEDSPQDSHDPQQVLIPLHLFHGFYPRYLGPSRSSNLKKHLNCGNNLSVTRVWILNNISMSERNKISRDKEKIRTGSNLFVIQICIRVSE